MKRKIIKIDESLCDGCGLCCNGCPEGALRLVDGKARLVGDLLCDGLGACIGTCPRGAIEVEEREAEPYDERRVMEENIVPKGAATIKAHLDHLNDHGEEAYLKTALAVLAEKGIPAPVLGGAGEEGGRHHREHRHDRDDHGHKHGHHEGREHGSREGHGHHGEGGGCPGLKAFSFRGGPAQASGGNGNGISGESQLRQWPVQLHLLNPRNPLFKGSNLLLAADCVAFAVGDFHDRFLKGKTLAIACPKLDEGLDRYVDKLAVMIDEGGIDTLTVVRMHVPCCGGLVQVAQQARDKATRNIPIKTITVDPEGTTLQEVWI